MSEDAPLVSVVVTCRNESRYARETLLSTESAYRGPLEVLIVDDASAEPGTRARLEDAARRWSDDRRRSEVVFQQTPGRAAARNRGLAMARGEFVQLLDCGDLLLPGKLNDQILHFRIADTLDVSVADCLFSDETLDAFGKNRALGDFGYRLRDFAAEWDRGFRLPMPCALFRRTIFATHAFDERPGLDEEWLFWSRVAAAGARVAFVGGPGALCRVRPPSLRRPDNGAAWLATAREIDPIVWPILPDFLADAIRWHGERVAAEAPVGAKAPSAAKIQPAPTARAAPRVGVRSAPPRMSVVVPVYEHFEYLERCLASAAAQCDGGVEIVVVDDGSRDPRVRPFLERFAAETGAKVLFRSDNQGVAATLNAAVANASGEYVAFLDCDDTLEPEALVKASAHIDADPDCDYLFTDRHDISETDEILRLARYGGYRDDRFSGEFRRDLLNGMVASHLKVIRRASIMRVGGFETAISGVQDWVMALEIAEFGRFGYLPEPLYNYRVHPNTVTQTEMTGQVWRANIVRRRFAERYFRTRSASRFSEGAASELAPRVLQPREVSPRNLGDEWSRRSIVVDASGDVTSAELGRLREFNGYIDKILWSAPEIQAALLGWVWSPDILQRA